MRLNLFLVLLIIVTTVGLSVYYENGSKPPTNNIEQKRATEYQTIPSFTVTDIKGDTYSTENFKNKTVILNFWASWCLPCVAEFPVLLEIAESNHSNTILLAISSDKNQADIDKFLKKIDMKQARLDNVIIALDDNKEITQDLFQTFKLPETIIVNGEGKMTRKFIGAEWTKEEMQSIIDQTQQDTGT